MVQVPDVTRNVSVSPRKTGGDTANGDSQVTVGDLRRKLNGGLNGGNGAGLQPTDREHTIRRILGLGTGEIRPDLSSDERLVEYLTEQSLSKISWLDSVDFLEGVLPDETYLYAEDPKTKDRINFEQLTPEAKRLFIIAKFFGGSFDRYLDTYKEKLIRTARDASKQLLLNDLASRDGSFSTSITYLDREVPTELQRVGRNHATLNGTYGWAVDFINADGDTALDIHRYLRDGNGTRQLVRTLMDKQRLRGNGGSDAVDYISDWAANPERLRRAALAFEELIEDIPIGANNLSRHLNALECKVASSTQEGSWSLWNVIGVLTRRRQQVDGLEESPSPTSSKTIETALETVEGRIARSAKEALQREQRVVEELKVRSRRQFLKTGGLVLAGVTVVAALGVGGVVLIRGAQHRHFVEESNRIRNAFTPHTFIDFQRYLDQAYTEMGTDYPPEARESRNAPNYPGRLNDYGDFKMSLVRKYFKILAVYLTPNLPRETIEGIQSGTMRGARDIPDDIRRNIPNDLRDLFTVSEWYFPIDNQQVGTTRPVYGQMIGQGFTNGGVYHTGILEQSRADNAIIAFLHPPFPTWRTNYRTDGTAGSRVMDENLIPPQDEVTVLRGVQPRVFVETDRNYLHIVQAINEMLRRISGVEVRQEIDNDRRVKAIEFIERKDGRETVERVELRGENVENRPPDFDGWNVDRRVTRGVVQRFARETSQGGNITGRKQQVINGYKESPDVLEINSLFAQVVEREDVEAYEPQMNQIVRLLERRQNELAPALRGIARCEVRLKELRLRVAERYNTIKDRNSYRAVLID